MKLLFKLFLALVFLLAGIYAASPLWAPKLLARQLPPGWQLEKLEIDYPGIAGINITELRMTGEALAAEIMLSAANVQVDYQSLATKIDSLSLEVHLQTTPDTGEAFTLEDLELPILQFTGDLPALSVEQASVKLYIESQPGPSTVPWVLELQKFQSSPQPGEELRMSAAVSLAGSPEISGRAEIELAHDRFRADLQIPAESNPAVWLWVQFEQETRAKQTTTQIQVAIDTQAMDQHWLDTLLNKTTAGALTHLTGVVKAQANFAGKTAQHIETLSLSTEKAQVVSDNESLGLSADFLVSREGEGVNIRLARPAQINYQASGGKAGRLFSVVLPGLQHKGDKEEKVSLRLTALDVEVVDLARLDSSTATGFVELEWEENKPFSYVEDDLRLQADKLSLSSSGKFRLAGQTFEFREPGDLSTQLENLQARLLLEGSTYELRASHYVTQGRVAFSLPLSVSDTPVDYGFNGLISGSKPVLTLSDDGSSLTTIVADSLSITSEATSLSGRLVSTGAGTLLGAQVTPMEISAAKIDFDWRDLDLINLAGKLSTKTTGFTASLDAETFTGFDFDVGYTLSENADVLGRGSIDLGSGMMLPLEFVGNLQTSHYNVTLPTTTIKLSQLEDLLAMANFATPPGLELGEGSLGLQADIIIGEELTAQMVLRGSGLNLSMLESNAREGSFTLHTALGRTADGPTLSASGTVALADLALAGGVDVQDIRAELSVDMEADGIANVGVAQLQAGVLGGHLDLQSLHYSQQGIAGTEVELTKIDLGRLLAFADIDGLEGSGALDFSLPVGSDQGGIHIHDGSFNSVGPGTLRYVEEGLAATNIGLQALKNFVYKSLSGTLNYYSDGNYELIVRLEGRNPDLYGGHSIVFTLNINGLLPEFFEALFITGNFEEAILNLIRSQ